MKTVVYAGSFDPITNGHLDIIKRATNLCGRLIIVVAVNPTKDSMFTLDARVDMIRRSVQSLPAMKTEIEIAALPKNELLVNFAKKRNACAMIRGLRPVQDFQGEFALASINRRVAPDIETIMLITDPSVSEISSSMVKELVLLNGPYQQFVPKYVAETLNKQI